MINLEKVFVTDFEFIDRDYLKKHNSLKRINQKFNSLYRQYQAVIDKETLFNFCEEIITEYVLDLDRDYIIIAKDKNKKGKYNDDISTMLVMMETRVIRKIDDWRGTYKEKKGDTTIVHTAPFLESLDKPLGRESDGNGWYSDNPATFADVATEKNNILYRESVDYKEVDSKLEQIYTDAMHECGKMNVSVHGLKLFYLIFFDLIVLSDLRNDGWSHTGRQRHITSDGFQNHKGRRNYCVF